MHVVISGYYGFNNVGDEAILQSIILALKKIHPNIEITVLSNNPNQTMERYEVHAIDRMNFFQLIRVIKIANGVISGGGSLLQDSTGIKSIPYYSGIIHIAKMLGKPVFIYAQGIGPIRRGFSRWMVQHILNKVDNITVRDQESQHLLKEIGVQKDARIVPDPVLGQGIRTFTKKEKRIAVSVRDWPSKVNYKEKIAKSLDWFAQQGYEILFVPMHGVLDEKASTDTAALMKEKSESFHSNASIEEKITCIGQSELLIGMRLHALVFASLSFTPFIALSYDPKIDAFAKMMEQPVVGHVEKRNWNEVTLQNTIDSVLAQLNLYQEFIRNKVQNENKKAKETAYLALSTFASTKGEEELWKTRSYYL